MIKKIVLFKFCLFMTVISNSQTLYVNSEITWSNYNQMYGLNNTIPAGTTLEIMGGGKLTFESGDAASCDGIIIINPNGTMEVFGSLELNGQLITKETALFAIGISGGISVGSTIVVLSGGMMTIEGTGMNVNNGQITMQGYLSLAENSTLYCNGALLIDMGGMFYNSGIVVFDNGPFTQYGDTKLMNGSLFRLMKQSQIQIWSGIFESDLGSTVEYYDKSGFGNLTGTAMIKGDFKWLGDENYCYLGGAYNFFSLPREFPKSLDVTHEAGAIVEYGN